MPHIICTLAKCATHIFAFKAQVIENGSTRSIKAEIMKKSQAREHFEAAKDEDRAAVFAQKHPGYDKNRP